MTPRDASPLRKIFSAEFIRSYFVEHQKGHFQVSNPFIFFKKVLCNISDDILVPVQTLPQMWDYWTVFLESELLECSWEDGCGLSVPLVSQELVYSVESHLSVYFREGFMICILFLKTLLLCLDKWSLSCASWSTLLLIRQCTDFFLSFFLPSLFQNIAI